MTSKKRGNVDSDFTVAPSHSSSKPSKRAHRDAAPVEHASMDQDEVMEFEDPWEDEIESDGEVVIAEDSSDEDDSDDDEDGGIANGDGMVVDEDAAEGEDGTKNGKKPQGKMKVSRDVTVVGDEEDEPAMEERVYLPGQELAADEVLVVDNSAYEMLHSLNVEWPCLSFDVIHDGLGPTRKKFPMTAYLAAGSQADTPKANRLYLLKLSHLHRTKHDDPDPDDSDADSQASDEHLDEDPVLEHRAIPHEGGVNRVRIMPQPSGAGAAAEHVVATWSETGNVFVWDVTDQITALDKPGTAARAAKDVNPMYTVKQHKGVEGFAMDWSGVARGKLLTGDISSKIYLTMRATTGYSTDSTPFTGHTSSVEDIQWSPREPTVFASCSADRTVRVWDTRAPKKPQVTVAGAHPADVNVISWSRAVDYLLASGGDDGGLAVWDLRAVAASAGSKPAKRPDPAAVFNWHKSAITSVEWHPSEGSVLAAAGADDQVTVWDLSVERDPEEEREVLGRTGQEVLGGVEVPPQLMFVHQTSLFLYVGNVQGQSNLKEIHWHAQLPGVIVSTALDGFNVFKTINT